MPGKKVIGVVFGSGKDLGHVRKLAGELRRRGWEYSAGRHLLVPGADTPRIFTAYAGSVHRDPDGTAAYVTELSRQADTEGRRLALITCVGLEDDATGSIASRARTLVIGIPPDSKPYNEYPKGVMARTFSLQENRDADISAGIDFAERMLDDPAWEYMKGGAIAKAEMAREDLLEVQRKIKTGEITF